MSPHAKFGLDRPSRLAGHHPHTDKQTDKPVGDMVRSLASMSLCKYRSSAHLLKLTRTSVKLSGKLVCDVARLVSIMIIRDDVISDVIRPGSTIREDHIDTPYRGTLY